MGTKNLYLPFKPRDFYRGGSYSLRSLLVYALLLGNYLLRFLHPKGKSSQSSSNIILGTTAHNMPRCSITVCELQMNLDTKDSYAITSADNIHCEYISSR